ncbi:MAG: hypothetical protein IE917_20605 [Betaproteobacteria bacterium]|nr:hypothetical protein [Betaproteobacteria bacterium]
MTAAILAIVLTASMTIDTPYIHGFRVVSSVQSGELDSIGIQWRTKF